MSYVMFGLQIDDAITPLVELAIRSRLATLDGFTKQMLLRSHYEETFGLSAGRSDDPMALVRMNPKEDMLTHGRIYNGDRRFIANEVQKHTGMSLIEFNDLPKHRCDHIYRIIEENRKAALEEAKRTQDNIEDGK